MSIDAQPLRPMDRQAVAMTAPAEQAARRRWMAVLAKAEREDIERTWATVPSRLPCTALRAPETGLAMVQARAGGSGARFHLGEVSLTRCTMRIEGHDVVGVAYVRGRDRRHAELAAIIDAHLQLPTHHDVIESHVIAPIERDMRARRSEESRKAQATKVEFFAMVRGEDVK